MTVSQTGSGQPRRTAIRANGLVGTLFEPDDDGPHPAVLLLGGSEGGLHEDDAALLATHGYAVLALAYFGMAGVPAHLVEVPLEYFGTALALLAARHDRIAVLGGSFGGQAALLVGATFPTVSAVVSVLGSGVITQGIDQGIADGDFLHILDAEVSPWTWQGRPLPFVANPVTPELRREVAAGEPVRLVSAFLAGLTDTDRVTAATIPVERIHGPVLLISAGEDASWPCEALSDIAERRLAAHRHPHEHRHVRFPRAGHGIIAPPHRPGTRTTAPGPGVTLDLGGTPEANARAQQTAWDETLRFLDTALKR